MGYLSIKGGVNGGGLFVVCMLTDSVILRRDTQIFHSQVLVFGILSHVFLQTAKEGQNRKTRVNFLLLYILYAKT